MSFQLEYIFSHFQLYYYAILIAFKFQLWILHNISPFPSFYQLYLNINFEACCLYCQDLIIVPILHIFTFNWSNQLKFKLNYCCYLYYAKFNHPIIFFHNHLASLKILKLNAHLFYIKFTNYIFHPFVFNFKLLNFYSYPFFL